MVFGEGSNSVHLSEQLANVIKISENIYKMINNCSKMSKGIYGVCKLKDTMTDHYILCVVTFVSWVPLHDGRKHLVKKPETLYNSTF